MQAPILRDKYVHEYGFVKLGMEILPLAQRNFKEATDLFMRIRASELSLKLRNGAIERYRARFSEDETDDPLVVENLAEALGMSVDRIIKMGKLLEGNQLTSVRNVVFYDDRLNFKHETYRVVLQIEAIRQIVVPNTTEEIQQIVLSMMQEQKVLA